MWTVRGRYTRFGRLPMREHRLCGEAHGQPARLTAVAADRAIAPQISGSTRIVVSFRAEALARTRAAGYANRYAAQIVWHNHR